MNWLEWSIPRRLLHHVYPVRQNLRNRINSTPLITNLLSFPLPLVMVQVSPPSPIPNGNSDSSLSLYSTSAPSVGNQLHFAEFILASAEVILASKSKARRRRTFTAEDDLIIVGEVCDAHSHIAKYGEVKISFALAAERANKNPNLSAKVTCKRLQN